MKTIFLSQNIEKLCKEEMLQLFELVTYLAAKKEISLQDAERYTTKIFNLLEKPRE